MKKETKSYSEFLKETNVENKSVESDNSLKQMIVNYVGNKLRPENEEVTVQMVVDVFRS